jgi:hypothetical protein
MLPSLSQNITGLVGQVSDRRIEQDPGGDTDFISKIISARDINEKRAMCAY